MPYPTKPPPELLIEGTHSHLKHTPGSFFSEKGRFTVSSHSLLEIKEIHNIGTNNVSEAGRPAFFPAPYNSKKCYHL